MRCPHPPTHPPNHLTNQPTNHPCSLSSQAMPGSNMLGLEIRGPIIERANKWAHSLGLDRSILFLK